MADRRAIPADKAIAELISAYLDQELDARQREALEARLADDPRGRAHLDEQGALDMLLKRCYSPEPPEDALEGLWPSISQELSDDPATGASASGNGAGRGEIVFRASPAMQILNVPDLPPEPTPEATSAAAAATVAVPEPQKAAGAPWLWPVAVMVAGGLIAGAVFMTRSGPGPQQAPALVASADQPNPAQPGIEPPPPAPSEPTAEPLSPDGEEGQPAEPGHEAAGVGEGAGGEGAGPEDKGDPAKASADDKQDKEDKDGDRSRAKRRKARRRDRDEASKPAPAPEEPKARPAAAAAAKPEPRPAKKKGGDVLDSLIDDAIGKPAAAPKPKEEKKPAKAEPSLPAQLSQAQIRTSMNRIVGLVGSCFDKYQVEGLANVALTITPAGEPTSVVIKGKFFGTDTGTCVKNAVGKAKFPRFSGPAMKIRYPFRLQ